MNVNSLSSMPNGQCSIPNAQSLMFKSHLFKTIRATFVAKANKSCLCHVLVTKGIIELVTS